MKAILIKGMEMPDRCADCRWMEQRNSTFIYCHMRDELLFNPDGARSLYSCPLEEMEVDE